MTIKRLPADGRGFGRRLYVPWRSCGTSGYLNRVRIDFEGHLPRDISGVILDAGCSYGYSSWELAEVCYPDVHIIGIDVVEERLPQDRKPFPNLEFQVGNFYFLRKLFPQKLFNGIFAMHNLLYVAKSMLREETEAIVKNFLYVLHDGGYLCMSGNGGCVVLHKIDNHFQDIFVSDNFRNNHNHRFGVLPEVLGIRGCFPDEKLSDDREEKIRASRKRG